MWLSDFWLHHYLSWLAVRGGEEEEDTEDAGKVPVVTHPASHTKGRLEFQVSIRSSFVLFWSLESPSRRRQCIEILERVHESAQHVLTIWLINIITISHLPPVTARSRVISCLAEVLWKVWCAISGETWGAQGRLLLPLQHTNNWLARQDQPGGWRDPKTVQARHSNITQTEITITAATTLQYHQANRLSKLPWLPCRLLFYLVLMLRHAIQKIRSDTQIDCWHSYFDTDITVGGQRGTWEIRK